jgi:hypothetical protein
VALYVKGREIIKERKPRNQVDNREKPVARKRSRESDNERKVGNSNSKLFIPWTHTSVEHVNITYILQTDFH